MRKYTLTGLFLCVFVFFGYSQTTATHTVRIIAKPILELQLENPGATPEFNFTGSIFENQGKPKLGFKC